MSIGGSLSGINFTGLASGLDTNTIVQQLMQIERIPVTRLQARRLELQARDELYNSVRRSVDSLRAAMAELGNASAYSGVKATSSDPAVATVAVSDGAGVGSFDLAIQRLASDQKMASAEFADPTTALGLEGSVLLNGKRIDIATTDSISQIAGKISASGTGVSATIVNGGPGRTVMSLTTTATGQAARLSLSALSGGALDSLGLVTSSIEARDLVDADTIRSFGFTASSAPLAGLIGAPLAGEITVGTSDIAIDFAADSLDTIASKINAVNSGATATVISVEENGRTVKKLELSGADVPAGLTDTNGILQGLGVLQRASTNPRVTAQDALYTVDGMSQQSATNTVKGIVSGVSITLISGDMATPKTTTVSLAQDTARTKEAVTKLKDAYNSLTTLISDNSSFDKESFEAGPLFGDALASQVLQVAYDSIFLSDSNGSSGLSSIGFSLDSDGKLALNESTLDASLASGTDGLRRTLTTIGSAAGAGLSFLGASAKSRGTGSGTYTVNISQAATKASALAEAANTLPMAGAETLRFSGTIFGSATVELEVSAGQTLQDLVDQINADARLTDKVSASIEGGRLKLGSARFGTPGSFTATSTVAAGGDNSGLGLTGGTYTEGLNVAGTIRGEPAEGLGQVLTGSSGNANTEGVQILYTESGTGDVGTITFSMGWAPVALDHLLSLTDTVNGALAATNKAIDDQVEDIGLRIAAYEERLTIREGTLRRKYLAMEQAISQLQRQQTGLGSLNQ